MTILKLTPRRRIQNLIEGKPVDRTPFCPAVYEHKAALIGVEPSELCRDADLFEKAIIREVEVYEPDMLVVGCDVYNVEAEAAGCRVFYPDSNDVPAVTDRAIRLGDDLSRLRVPNPLCDGRMPLHLEVGRRIRQRFGAERLVRGALSAPLSIACELVGPEQLLMAMLDRPDWVSRLLSFTSEITKAYGKAFVERGLGVILFDSHASPPLLSPALYKKMILPPTAEVIRYFRSGLGVPLVPNIMGGDTTVLLDAILETGTNNLLCDHKADLNVFVDRLKDEPVLLRANIDPLMLVTQPIEAIRTKARGILSVGRRHPRFLMGTGILPYDIAPERVIALREAIQT
ncbi:MAG: uroporphyrinogen decarboxylase family protein [Candidatus Aminicenantales bacterium]